MSSKITSVCMNADSSDRTSCTFLKQVNVWDTSYSDFRFINKVNNILQPVYSIVLHANAKIQVQNRISLFKDDKPKFIICVKILYSYII